MSGVLILGVDSDNGAEFINVYLFIWCRNRKITFTRARPTNKNDGCHVEQKNWAVVRTVVGYHRYDTAPELLLLNEIWQLQSQLTNYFYPQQKLISKVRDGAKVTKKYDTATTPFEHRRRAGARSDAFFFDFDGIKNLFDTSGKRNFTAPHLAELGGKSPWTGQDSNTEANVCSMAIELPTSTLGATGPIRIWGRCSLRENGTLNHVDRAGHPSVSSFFNTDDTKLEYNASEPPNDWNRWLDQFVHLMGHTGGYTREEAIAVIEKEGTLPDMLTFDPAKPAQYPNGRVFTDDVIDYRLAFLTKGECPPSGLSPHTDTLTEFPYLGPPHAP